MELVNPSIGLIFWTTLVFLILLFVLSKYAWKPMLSAVKQRESSIEDALKAAEKAREDIQKLTSDNEKLLQEARLERDRIIKEATQAANLLKQEAADRATAEANQILQKARTAIDTEKEAAKSELRTLVAQLSLEIAEKILRSELKNDQKNQDLVQTYLRETKLN